MRTISHKIILLITLLIKTFGNLINFLTQNPLLNLTFLFLYSFLSLLSLLKNHIFESPLLFRFYSLSLSLSFPKATRKQTTRRERYQKIPLRSLSLLKTPNFEFSKMSQKSLIYAFVSRGTVILADYTEFSGNFNSIAFQCLQKLPATNNKFTYNCDGHTFNYLVDNGFSKCF